jgi:hypothetical protein
MTDGRITAWTRKRRDADTDLGDGGQPLSWRGPSDEMKTNSHSGEARTGASPPGAASIANQGSGADAGQYPPRARP